MTRSTLLGLVPLFLLATACGSDDDSAATPASGGSGAQGGSAGAAGSSGAAGAAGSAGAPSCTGTQTTDPRLSQALGVLQEELGKAGVPSGAIYPGGAIAIVKDGQLVDVAVTGSKRASACDPITPDTMFMAGFLTQLITNVAVLDAEEDGKLSVTDPITKWVPAIAVNNTDYGTADGITLHHLLTSSSMYVPESSQTGTTASSDCFPSIADEFASVKSAVLYATPGSMLNGLMSDTELAGLALENAEGKPFADVARQRVLEPLGMGGTFENATFLASDHADGSDLLSDCANREPSAQYFASIRDLAKLAEYLTGGAGQILDAPAFDALFSEQGPTLPSFMYAASGANGFRADAIGDVVLNSSSWHYGYVHDTTIWKNRRLAVITVVNGITGFPGINVVWNTSSRVAKIYDPSIGPNGSWRDYDSPPTPESLPSLAGTYKDALGFKGSGPRTIDVFVDPADNTKLAGTLVDSMGASLPVTFDGTRSLENPTPSADNFVMRGAVGTSPAVRFWRDAAGSVWAVSIYGSYGPPFFRVP